MDQVLADEVLPQSGQADAVYWPLADNEGTIRDIADASGAEVDHLPYTAFGGLVAESGVSGDNELDIGLLMGGGYTGGFRDPLTGLVLEGERWLVATAGTWLTNDPLGFAAGDPNLTRYAGNDPTNGIDPNGTDSLSLVNGGAYWNIDGGGSWYLGTAANSNSSTVRLDDHYGGNGVWTAELDRAIGQSDGLSGVPAGDIDSRVASLLATLKSTSPPRPVHFPGASPPPVSDAPAQLGGGIAGGAPGADKLIRQRGPGQDEYDPKKFALEIEQFVYSGIPNAAADAGEFAVSALETLPGGATTSLIVQSIENPKKANATTPGQVFAAIGSDIITTGLLGMAFMRAFRGGEKAAEVAKAEQVLAKDAQDVAALRKGGRDVALSGNPAEEAASRETGIARNTGSGRDTIPESGPGGVRYPDLKAFGDEGTIVLRGSVVEVKDVARLEARGQMRDFIRFVQENKLNLEIFTNAPAPQSGPIADGIKTGFIKLRPMP